MKPEVDWRRQKCKACGKDIKIISSLDPNDGLCSTCRGQQAARESLKRVFGKKLGAEEGK